MFSENVIVYFKQETNLAEEGQTNTIGQARNQGGCKGAVAPPFLLKEVCNDEFAPPPPQSHIKEIVSHNFLKSSYQ